MPVDSERARYVFRVRFHLAPVGREVTTSPATFETTLYRQAAVPGESGWRFFRDNLWRGELADETHFRTLTEDVLGVPIESVSFAELQTTPGYLDALKREIRENLGDFKADSVDEVLSKYLGSSIHVRENFENQ